ncbi:hypothetical protein KFK09_007516 [Dendrobium nobile]|uniref:Uncharacterized protein n=1 Tax=Dendrobium nobile TaxID=94219 RepID=A0A8T3BWQ5_DENNO|nr:hypothetical protein KFK09_007516 [Dendrobium nobile]
MDQYIKREFQTFCITSINVTFGLPIIHLNSSTLTLSIHHTSVFSTLHYTYPTHLKLFLTILSSIDATPIFLKNIIISHSLSHPIFTFSFMTHSTLL